MQSWTKRCSSRRPGAAVGVSRGKLLSPERRRRAVCVLQDRFRVSQRRACRLAGQNRNTQRRPVPVTAIDEQKLRRRIRELARRHVRWGRRLVYRRLRLEGWSLNDNRVQRIWREEELLKLYPPPTHLRMDNGPEFIANALQEWSAGSGCNTAYIPPGSPWENPFVESFNRRLRNEFLSIELFTSVQEAKLVVG